MADYVDAVPEHLRLVRARCGALPDVWDEPAWAGHRFLVRKKNFAHVFGLDEGQSFRSILSFRSPDDERDSLLAVGHPFFRLGWGYNAVGMVLDGDTDWDEVTELVTESYCLVAPKKLVAQVDRPEPA